MKTLRLLDLGHTLSAEQLRNVNSSSVRRRLNIAVSSLIEKVEARRGSEGLRQHRKTSSKPLLRRGTNSNPTQLQTNPTSHSDRPTSAKNNPNDHRRKIAPAKKAPVPTVRQQRRIHPAASKPKPRPIPTETSQVILASFQSVHKHIQRANRQTEGRKEREIGAVLSLVAKTNKKKQSGLTLRSTTNIMPPTKK